eukprot:767796-Hanusia_phi.AAC.4
MRRSENDKSVRYHNCAVNLMGRGMTCPSSGWTEQPIEKGGEWNLPRFKDENSSLYTQRLAGGCLQGDDSLRRQNIGPPRCQLMRRHSWRLNDGGGGDFMSWCTPAFAGAESKQMSDTLMSAIQEIARTGVVSYNWTSLVHLLVFQLKNILEDSSEDFPVVPAPGLAGEATYQESCNRLYSILAQFHGFVVTSSCALLVDLSGLQPSLHCPEVVRAALVAPPTPQDEIETSSSGGQAERVLILSLIRLFAQLLSVTTIVSEHELCEMSDANFLPQQDNLVVDTPMEESLENAHPQEGDGNQMDGTETGNREGGQGKLDSPRWKVCLMWRLQRIERGDENVG